MEILQSVDKRTQRFRTICGWQINFPRNSLASNFFWQCCWRKYPIPTLPPLLRLKSRLVCQNQELNQMKNLRRVKPALPQAL